MFKVSSDSVNPFWGTRERRQLILLSYMTHKRRTINEVKKYRLWRDMEYICMY